MNFSYKNKWQYGLRARAFGLRLLLSTSTSILPSTLFLLSALVLTLPSQAQADWQPKIHNHSQAHAATLAKKNKLVVYTNRKKDLIKPLLDRFAKQHKLSMQVYYGGDSLLERIKQEGKNTPADIVITQNIAMVQQLKDSGLTARISKPTLKNVPSDFIDRHYQWAGVSYRVRIIVVAKATKANSKAMNITNIKQLADEQWRGKICMRDGFHPYNLGLLASLKTHMSHREMKIYLKKLKSNLVQKPGGNDRDQIKLVYGGQCEIAVVNSYYYGLLKKEIPNLETRATPRLVSLVGKKLGAGVANNISAVAIVKNAKNKPMAEKLIGFLLSPTAQNYFMTKNNEYPVRNDIAWGQNLISLDGKKFTSDTRAMVTAYKNYPRVIKILLAINFNGG